MTGMRPPFSIAVDQAVLDRIQRRVAEYRWDAVPDAGGWSRGVDLTFLRALCDHWQHRFDWRAQEQHLNRLPQFTANVDGIDIHFFHIKSGNPNRALLLTHGWPGSVVEFIDVIEPLAFPERFGGDAADAFDVIVPALPGFGFSGRPAAPIGPRAIAALFATLMKDVLGYRHYIAQGGDWGATVSSWMGYDDAPTCRGVHLNMVGVSPASPPETDAEKAWYRQIAGVLKIESAYNRQQSTKPQTLAIGLMDSPVGIAAWIAEKFGRWADVPGAAAGTPDLGGIGFDKLLTNIMFYVATDAFATSAWIYNGFAAEKSNSFPAGTRCDTPTGVAAFPDPCFPAPPRSRIERAYNLVHYTQPARGGHFAAFEQPQLFVEDVRAFARKLDRQDRQLLYDGAPIR